MVAVVVVAATEQIIGVRDLPATALSFAMTTSHDASATGTTSAGAVAGICIAGSIHQAAAIWLLLLHEGKTIGAAASITALLLLLLHCY